MGKLRKILKRYEKWCIDWKRTLAIGWIGVTVFETLVFINPWTTSLAVFLWISWGIGYRVPQDAYQWIKERKKK